MEERIVAGELRLKKRKITRPVLKTIKPGLRPRKGGKKIRHNGFLEGAKGKSSKEGRTRDGIWGTRQASLVGEKGITKDKRPEKKKTRA